jgi:PIN domain nuclease of toxin-antitoxin system
VGGRLKLLLDTHIWLWSQLAPERLSKKVARALEAPTSEVWLSPISVWEFFVLAERGRLKIKGSARGWLEEAWGRAPIREAPFNNEIAAQSRFVDVPHDDPADRFIAATAEVMGLILVTEDERLLEGKGYKKLANR